MSRTSPFYHQFWLKDGLLLRLLMPQRDVVDAGGVDGAATIAVIEVGNSIKTNDLRFVLQPDPSGSIKGLPG